MGLEIGMLATWALSVAEDLRAQCPRCKEKAGGRWGSQALCVWKVEWDAVKETAKEWSAEKKL